MKKTRLLLLPGVLTDARAWAPQIAALSDVADATVADLTSADNIAALAAAALASIPSEHFALAGFSMGGYVALEIMRQAPGRVLGLALLDTSARPDTPESTDARRKQMELAETKFQLVLNAQLPKLIHPAHLNDTTIVNTITAMATDNGKDAFIRQQRACMERIDSRPFLQRIDCPTLVLCGREDLITPLEVHEELAAGIPDARLVIVEQCGHLSLLDQPQAVAEALRKWLSRLLS